MKKNLLIVFAVLVTSAVVFAAAKTTFYTILDMTNHKITNVATPTSNSDAATKQYADTKLAKTGGTMTGAINMGGEKITSLAPPTASNDAANKSYVDTAVAESVKPGYQYFALRKGGKYDPLVSLNSAITGDFWVVVLRPVSGSVTTYTDNVTLKAGKFFSRKSWTVGETIRIPYTLGQEVSTRTNAALTVSTSAGGVGNWGVTFPPLNPGPTFMTYFGTTAYTPGTPVDISSYVSSEGNFTFGITNCTSSAITALNFCYVLKKYTTDTTMTLSIYPTFPGTINAHECVWFNCTFTGYTNATGAVWSYSLFNVDLGYFNFGPFFVPNR